MEGRFARWSRSVEHEECRDWNGRGKAKKMRRIGGSEGVAQAEEKVKEEKSEATMTKRVS